MCEEQNLTISTHALILLDVTFQSPEHNQTLYCLKKFFFNKMAEKMIYNSLFMKEMQDAKSKQNFILELKCFGRISRNQI